MPLRTVVLRHDRPGVPSHFDWLLAVDGPPVRPLLTWRCEDRPDRAAVGEVLAAQRIAPHRAVYLEYEGPVSGDRGTVQRIAEGVWTPASVDSPPAAVGSEPDCIAADVHAAEGTAAAEHPLEIEVVWSGSGIRQRWRLNADSARRLG